jgi:glycosyltransferase involved in cell wall biosynthesis
MRLVIQIPCFNEEATLAETLDDLPASVPGVDEVVVLVIDDGSTDRTAQIARARGARTLRLPENRGLANAFRVGLDEAVRLGADLIVNTDGDHQYRGEDIARLVEPILAGRADLVVGTRDIERVPGFSWTKKRLQRVGSAVLRKVSGTRVADATSGFRALTREAALRLNVFSDFTYTLETLIQAGRNRLTVECVPVGVNPTRRASRLFSGNANYVLRSVVTMVRVYALYRPLQVFLAVAGLFLGAGTAIGLRFLYFLATGGHQGHVQSLILAAICLIVGFQFALFGLLAEVNAANRRLLEETLRRLRQIEADRPAGATRDPE